MTPNASGKAIIKHAETGEIYEIESSLLEFHGVGGAERNMGPEFMYSADFEHPQLGLLIWSLWEYPIGVENYSKTDVGPHELLQNIEFWLESEPLYDEDDFREHYDNKENFATDSVTNITSDLSALIGSLSEPQAYPTFTIGSDNLLHIAPPPDSQIVRDGDQILEELVTLANDLRQSLTGTNVHIPLLNSVEQYCEVFSDKQISISRLYARGIRLENSTAATKQSIVIDGAPSLPIEVEQNLNSVIELHHAYIMLTEEGKKLVQAASAYNQPSKKIEQLRVAGNEIASFVGNNPQFFGEDTREHVTGVVSNIGKGAQPEKSNQIATYALFNLIYGIFKSTLERGKQGVAIIVVSAILESQLGTAAVAEITDVINATWIFLLTHISSLEIIVSFVGGDTSWTTSFSHIVNRIQSLKEAHEQTTKRKKS